MAHDAEDGGLLAEDESLFCCCVSYRRLLVSKSKCLLAAKSSLSCDVHHSLRLEAYFQRAKEESDHKDTDVRGTGGIIVFCNFGLVTQNMRVFSVLVNHIL